MYAEELAYLYVGGSALGDSIVLASIGMYSTRIPLMFYTRRGPHEGAYDPHGRFWTKTSRFSRKIWSRADLHVHVHVVCV